MVEKYINPHTDFGFKRLFGSEFNKELLISFLNAMFHGEQNVQDVTYLNSEQLGDRVYARRAIFDVYCENDKVIRYTPSVCSTSTLPKVCRMPNVGIMK